MYLHHLLTRDKSELISKVYFAQLRKPLKDDWATTVMKDCTDLTINPEAIKDMKKERFKTYLKKKIEMFSFDYLQKKKMGHSKVKDIDL